MVRKVPPCSYAVESTTGTVEFELPSFLPLMPLGSFISYHTMKDLRPLLTHL